MRRLLVYCPVALGGIYDYALKQTEALAAQGVEVTLLAADSSVPGSSPKVRREASLHPEFGTGGARWQRAAHSAVRIIGNLDTLRRYIQQRNYRHVLMATYSEYGSPGWAPALRLLAARGVRFAAILHDPVRDYVVGPRWFHDWSVRSGYSYLSDVFVHEAVSREEARIPASVAVTVVPHGPYEFPAGRGGPTSAALREQWGIPEDAHVMLSFGQIRAGKNLPLVLEAMAHHPSLWLLVVGQEASAGAALVPEYQALATQLGVAERCRFLPGFVPAGEVAPYFEVADLILLTYSRHFRSASGVLNTAVQFRRPCLVSSGPGALWSLTERYGLGIRVEPDSAAAIKDGLARWLQGIPAPDWEGYVRDNSWERNAVLVTRQMFGSA
ncbi:MAG: glycosyltransferase family 4 protein [Acidobacteria bacterium]|nr:glycosyltransferase family 4 protein [Acidobacteriota bacterium]